MLAWGNKKRHVFFKIPCIHAEVHSNLTGNISDWMWNWVVGTVVMFSLIATQNVN